MPPIIDLESFIKKDDAQYVEVDVKGWGLVRLKSLTGSGRDSYYTNQFETKNGKEEFRLEDSSARLLALSLCDEEGNLWFPDDAEGVRVLREKGAGSLQQAFEAALKLNGLSSEEFETEKKDSTEVPNVEDGSTSV